MDLPSELQEWPGHVGNWARWTNDRSALNLITSAATARGIESAREGRLFPCAREALEKDPVMEICESPVDRRSLVFWGVPLVHNMKLEELGEFCAAEERDDFLFMISALNIPKTTGSPCTTVAVL